MTVTAFLFPKLRTLKTWLDKCLKSPASYDPWTSNMVNVPKLCWNLNHSSLIIFIGHWQGNCVPKSLSYWQSKSWDWLLTHWLLIKKCPVLNRDSLTIPIEMQWSQKQKYFSQFFAAFFKSRLNFKHFSSKDYPHRFFIFEVKDSENVVR